MSRTPGTVLYELLAISPDGDALPLGNQPGDIWPLWLTPLATEISRFEGLADTMMVEVDPRDANYLLPDYIRMLGPDPYGRDTSALTTQEQQALVYQRLTARGGQSVQYFIDLAASLGVTITIDDQIGVFECGDGECGDELSISPQDLNWLVTLPNSTTVTDFECGASDCGDLMGSFDPSPVVPAILADQPAHGNVVFSYLGS